MREDKHYRNGESRSSRFERFDVIRCKDGRVVTENKAFENQRKQSEDEITSSLSHVQHRRYQ